MGIVIGSAVIPLWNLMTWDKANASGAIIAAWGGLSIRNNHKSVGHSVP